MRESFTRHKLVPVPLQYSRSVIRERKLYLPITLLARLSRMPSIHQREIKQMANYTIFSGINLNCQRQPERVRRMDAPNKQLFKCTEKEGFYSVSEPISEQDIIAFAKTIIVSLLDLSAAQQ